MNKITKNIPLPQIEGVELKNATVDLEKGVVVAEYGEEEGLIEAKKGDFLTFKEDPSKVVIFEAMAGMFGGVDSFTIIYDLPTYIDGAPTYTLKGVRMPISRFRHSTEEEKALMIEEMEKLGKRYNPRTFRIDEINQDLLNKYKYLIGVCFNTSNETYIKITSIDDVDGEDIRIKGFGISLREDVLPIRFEIYSYVTEKFIKDNEISRARFSILFELVVERIREEYDM